MANEWRYLSWPIWLQSGVHQFRFICLSENRIRRIATQRIYLLLYFNRSCLEKKFKQNQIPFFIHKIDVFIYGARDFSKKNTHQHLCMQTWTIVLTQKFVGLVINNVNVCWISETEFSINKQSTAFGMGSVLRHNINRMSVFYAICPFFLPSI